MFYVAAARLADDENRAEYDAVARYYVNYNAIGSEFDYDEDRINEAGKGDRWIQLRTRPPLSVESAIATVKADCDVELPPPPTTITTTTTTTARVVPTTTAGAPDSPTPTTP